MKKEYSKEELQKICNSCTSNRQLTKKLGLSPNSSDSVKKIVYDNDLDISHFTGQAWNKNKVDMSIFQYNKSSKSTVLLRALSIIKG